jgi:hypothetical protein
MMLSDAAMKYDFNALEQRAQELVEAGRVNEAIRIYLFDLVAARLYAVE